MNLRSRVTKEFNRHREDYRHHGVVQTISRANPEEFEEKKKLSKKKAAGYLGAAALFGVLAHKSEGALRAGAIVGTIVSGLNAWSNIAKAGIYGAGPESWQTESTRIRERLAENEAPQQAPSAQDPIKLHFIHPEEQG